LFASGDSQLHQRKSRSVTSWKVGKVDECRGWIRPRLSRCRPVVPADRRAVVAVDRKTGTSLDSVAVDGVAPGKSDRFDEGGVGLADGAAICNVRWPRSVANRSKRAAPPWSHRGRWTVVSSGAGSVMAYGMTVSSDRGRTRSSGAVRNAAAPHVPGDRDASPGLTGLLQWANCLGWLRSAIIRP
jgi:hypothetical protein